jgi:haloalkane dehalogenase
VSLTRTAEQARVLARGPFPDYPFEPRRFDRGQGIEMSWLDEGPRDAEPVVMLHGNPSWSYYWRKLVLGLRSDYRCIVPDHVGMGFSDKPGDDRYAYTLQSRVDDLEKLLDHAGVGDNVTLAVHDWGGMIGFGWALKHAARVKRLVVLNTSSFPLPAAKAMPWQLKLGRDSKLGALLIRGANAFAAGAALIGTERRMDAAVRHAYTAPYDSWDNRIATLRFVQDIPLEPGDPAWSLVERAGQALPSFADRPAFLGWGLKDFVFDHHFLDGFRAALPNATERVFADAGHYVLEERADELVPAIREFLQRHPLTA